VSRATSAADNSRIVRECASISSRRFTRLLHLLLYHLQYLPHPYTTPISPLLLSLPSHASACSTEPTSRTDARHSVVTSAEKVERGIRPGRCVERHARVARRNRVAGCRRSHAHVHTQRTHMHSYAYTPTYAHRDARADGLLVISRGTARFRSCFLSFLPLSSFSSLPSPLSVRAHVGTRARARARQ